VGAEGHRADVVLVIFFAGGLMSGLLLPRGKKAPR